MTGITGKSNSIVDVEGVEVGFSTIIEGDSIRTGVTAIFPRGLKKVFHRMPCFANWFSLNGDGEMTGMHYLTESGFLTAPILITNTNSVGICRDSLIKWALQKNNSNTMVNMLDFSLPIVAETYDGYLNDINGFHVKEEHVFEALDNAKGSDSLIQEGNVGGGTGMISFGFKAGTEASSRKIDGLNYTIGVLVQSNFGRKKQLIITGVPHIIEEKVIRYRFQNDNFQPLLVTIVSGDDGNDCETHYPLCPYGKKCTYGSKCKYFHIERRYQNPLSITESLQMKARLEKSKLQHQSSNPSIMPVLINNTFKSTFNHTKSVPDHIHMYNDRHSPTSFYRMMEQSLTDDARTAYEYGLSSTSPITTSNDFSFVDQRLPIQQPTR
ncbi:unnamed protein product [Rotaria sp. Silwood2]|nr:unnamed protein product [Rotaria sp. Silwood2]